VITLPFINHENTCQDGLHTISLNRAAQLDAWYANDAR
jgi:hypothetical protein